MHRSRANVFLLGLPRVASFGSDVIAGLTLWAVFAAQALAYSRLAHATATAGLITAIAGALLYALLGTSRRTSIGPAGGIAAIVGASVSGIAPEHLAPSLALLTLMTGGFLCVAGLLRISFLQRLFPAPVFVGYLAGTGVTILVGQGKDLIADRTSLAIGGVAIAMVLALKRLVPKVPAPFVVLLLATIASVVFDFADRGVGVIGTSLGHLSAPSLPTGLDWATVRGLIAPALGLALIVYVDALANAAMLAQHDDPPVQPIREYFAHGAIDLAAGLFGGFAAGASSSRSIVGIRAGAKTKLAGAVAGVLLLLTALSVVRFLTPMPLAALAGVVFVAAFDLIDWRRMREFFHLRRADFWIALISAASVVFIGMLEGIVIGIAAALVEVFRRAMYPNRLVVSGKSPEHLYEPFSIDVVDHAHGTLIYRFGTALFFGNADVFLADMRRIAETNHGSVSTVLVNADALGIPDATARDAIVAASHELADHGITLEFGNVRRAVRQALEEIGGLTIVDERTFLGAVRAVRAHH